MRALKKFLALLLVIIMLMTVITYTGVDFSSVLGTKARALGDDWDVPFEENCRFSFEGGMLTIYGTGPMEDYETIGYNKSPFSNDSTIRNVRIERGITSISRNLFYNCTNLVSISIAESVTSIGDSAFFGCENLENVYMSNNITTIGADAFYGCTSLTDIQIPNGVTDIGTFAFFGCKSLTNVKIQNSNIRMGSGVFHGCTGMTSISFPVGLTNIWESAFSDCTGLTSITIPDGVKVIEDGAFSGCDRLTSVTLPDSVEEIGFGAFEGCTSLTKVNVESVESWCNTKFKSSRGYAYSESNPLAYAHNIYLNNKLVTDLVIPDGVTSISDYAFLSCECLTSLKIPDSVTSIGEGTFNSCEGITEVYFAGTEEQWKNVDIGVYNSYVENATFHFNWVCEHDYELLNYIARSDCSHEGLANYKCQICKKIKTDIVPVNPGSHNLKHMITSATCTSSGYEYDICTSCYQMLNYSVIPVKGHNWGEWVIDNPATCTTEGLRHHICTACEDTREDEVIPAHGHSYKHMVNSATCEKDGTEYDICTECMDTKNIVILPKTGHDWNEWVYVSDATCTVDGLKYHTCKNNETEKEEVVIKAEGHSYKDEVVAQTCEERGFTFHTCMRCGESKTDTYVEPTGHSFEWQTTVNPTINSEGIMVKKCLICEKIVDEMILPCLVPDYVMGITISSEKEAINIGESVTLTATVNPDTAKNKNIIWKSSENDVATVSNGTVTALKPGVTVITAQTEDSGYKEYCLVRVIGIVPVADSNTVIDNENGLIYGLSVNSTDIEEFIYAVDDNLEIDCTSAVIGTGTQVNIISDGQIIDTYETVIFGDTNGDNWYDGMDAIIVNCIANGLLSQNVVGKAAYMAADCNHDGAIDSADVAILEQAGIILANVDQSKSAEELLETSSAYVEYLSLIDQSAGNVNDTPDENVANETNIFEWLISFIVKILNYFRLHFSIIK